MDYLDNSTVPVSYRVRTMRNPIIDLVEKPYLKPKLPEFHVGDSVDVLCRIVEGGKERIQTFAGVVIARRGHGMSESFVVRRTVHEVGVERIFPVHSPNVVNVKVRRRGKVRRAKLYFLRTRIGKKRHLRERRVTTKPAMSGRHRTLAPLSLGQFSDLMAGSSGISKSQHGQVIWETNKGARTLGRLFAHNRELAEGQAFTLGTNAYLTVLFFPFDEEAAGILRSRGSRALTISISSEAFSLQGPSVVDLTNSIFYPIRPKSLVNILIEPIIEGKHELTISIYLVGHFIGSSVIHAEIVRPTFIPTFDVLVPVS